MGWAIVILAGALVVGCVGTTSDAEPTEGVGGAQQQCIIWGPPPHGLVAEVAAPRAIIVPEALEERR